MQELKPCPFCGGKPVTYHDFFGKDFSSVHIKCDGCSSLSGTYTHEHQAIDAWNKRIPLVLHMKPNGLILSRNKQEPDTEGWIHYFIEQSNGDFVGVTQGPPFVIEIGKQNDL